MEHFYGCIMWVHVFNSCKMRRLTQWDWWNTHVCWKEDKMQERGKTGSTEQRTFVCRRGEISFNNVRRNVVIVDVWVQCSGDGLVKLWWIGLWSWLSIAKSVTSKLSIIILYSKEWANKMKSRRCILVFTYLPYDQYIEKWLIKPSNGSRRMYDTFLLITTYSYVRWIIKINSEVLYVLYSTYWTVLLACPLSGENQKYLWSSCQ